MSGKPRTIIATFRLRHLGRRQKVLLLAHDRVLIETEHGFWRENCAGYTFAETAAEYSGADAYAATSHCGPEKQVRYYLLGEQAP